MIPKRKLFFKANLYEGIKGKWKTYGKCKKCFLGGSKVGGTRFMVVKLKELIKTVVFAVLGVIILVGLIWFFLSLGDNDSGTYRDGVYHTQLAVGDESAMVSVTIEDGKIEDVALTEVSESTMVFYPLLQSAAEEVCKEVVKTQSLTIQVSQENAYSAQAILEAVAQGLEEAKK
jgi:uncharacterized protein with FMN-binding domain